MTLKQAREYRRKIEGVASKVDDSTALDNIDLFRRWSDDEDVAAGDRRQYDGRLYKCVQAHHTQAVWKPKDTPALWVEVSTDEWPEWVRPTGAHDAYMKGDKVSHNGGHWISTYDGANVWEPGAFGWEME